MQGTGTSENPYLVKSIAELREAATKSGAYVKVIADLDCNEENYLEWETLNISAKEIDFDGRSLTKPYIKTGNVLFNGSTIKNAKILKVYENGANAVITNARMEYVALTAFLSSIVGAVLDNCTAQECNFIIENKNPKSGWFTMQDPGYKHCRFLLTGRAPNGVFYSWNDRNPGIMVANGCRIEGKVTGLASGKKIVTGSISDCVIALDTSDAESGTILADAVTTATVYQSDISGLSDHKTAIPCTHDEIRDPDHLNSDGFYVAEVK